MLLLSYVLVFLENVEQHNVLRLELLVPEGLLQEAPQFVLSLDLPRQVVDDDCVVGQHRGALVVVVARLVYCVTHVDQAQEVDQEGTTAQNDLGVTHYLVSTHEPDQPARANPVKPSWKYHESLLIVAELVVGVVCPEEGEDGVAGSLHQQQDDVVLIEDEVERECEAEEIQFFGVFAQRNRLFVDDV
jgi:hypothetical protein